MLMLALRLFLKDKGGGKQHCLISFVGSNLGVETFLKEMEHQKRMRYSRGLRHLCILCIVLRFQENLFKVCLLLNYFLVIKGILKTLFSSIPWLLNFFDLPNYGSNSRKRYTIRLLSKCLVRSTLLPIIEGKVPPNPLILSLVPLDGLHLCSS